MVLEKFLNDSWTICKLIEGLVERGLFSMAFRLFKKLFDVKFDLQKRLFSSPERIEYIHSFLGKYYEIERTWNLISEKANSSLEYDVLCFVRCKIEELHCKYEMVNQASYENEPFELSFLDIEDEDEDYKNDPLLVLCKMYVYSAKALVASNPVDLKMGLLRDICTDSILMRKIVLKAIRSTEVLLPTEKIDLLIKNNLIAAIYEREQVFRIAYSVFNKISDEEKDRLIDTIVNNSKGDNDKHSEYRAYNWCVWLQRADKDNFKLRNVIDMYETEYGFKPRKHPERLIDSSSAKWDPDQSPLSDEELKGLSIAEAVDQLANYKEDPFEGPSRTGLLRTFASCVMEDYTWALRIVESLLERKVNQQDIWSNMFVGLVESNYTMDEAIKMLEILVRNIEDIDVERGLAEYLWKVVKQDDVRESFATIEGKLLSISKAIWNNRKHEKPVCSRIIDSTFNTTSGLVILSWIQMVSYHKEATIPEEYKELFENALKIKTWDKRVSICILAGHFNFLCYRDCDWSIKNLRPCFVGKSKLAFASAWEGMVCFSRRLNRDTAEIMAPVYLRALSRIEWLDGDAKHGFIEMFLTLLIYIIDAPTREYIPAFYKSASKDDINAFIHAIDNRLMNMDVAQKKEWWNNWLKEYLSNRKECKPIPLLEEENRAIVELLPELEFAFEEAVGIICKGTMPNSVDTLFWHTLNENHVANNYPHSMVRVITEVLKNISNIGFERDYLMEIRADLKDIDEDEKKQIDELFLHKGIL